MIYRVSHRTRFKYDASVRFARCNLRLKPIEWPGQSLGEWALEVTPRAQVGETGPQGWPANVTRILIGEPARELVVESRMLVTVVRAAPAPLPDDPSVAEAAAAALASADLSATAPANYIYPSPRIALDPDIASWCAEELRPTRGVVEACLALATRIHAEFRYDGDATPFDTDPAEAFRARAGVCQDFAQVMIAGCRAAGLAAGYVSGYLRTTPPPGRPRLVGADATHAWVMVWCGARRGWLGFDPTNACTMGPDHIVTALGRDYADIAPIDGVFVGRDGQTVDVAVDVAPAG